MERIIDISLPVTGSWEKYRQSINWAVIWNSDNKLSNGLEHSARDSAIHTVVSVGALTGFFC